MLISNPRVIWLPHPQHFNTETLYCCIPIAHNRRTPICMFLSELKSDNQKKKFITIWVKKQTKFKVEVSPPSDYGLTAYWWDLLLEDYRTLLEVFNHQHAFQAQPKFLSSIRKLYFFMKILWTIWKTQNIVYIILSEKKRFLDLYRTYLANKRANGSRSFLNSTRWTCCDFQRIVTLRVFLSLLLNAETP